MSKVQWGDAGWLHVLNESVVATLPVKREPEVKRVVDFTDMHHMCVAGLDINDARWLAQDLGVSLQSLQTMGLGWYRPSGCYSFPMVDETWTIIGLRLRKPDGFKFAVTGSCNALFVPASFSGEGIVYIVEGPTDCAAMLDMGLDAIGRPSSSSCVDMTRMFLAHRGVARVVIIADHDDPKTHPRKGVWFPGRQGAETLADALCETCDSVRVIEPLKAKDVRSWQFGAKKQALRDTISNTKRWSHKPT